MVRIPASWARAGYARLAGSGLQTGVAARRIPVLNIGRYDTPVTVDLGNDGIAPQITLAGAGTQAGILNPPANSGLLVVPVQPGPVTINWTVTLAGTVGASDVNNFVLFLPGAGLPGNVLATSVNPGVAGSYPQAPVTVTVPAGAGPLFFSVRGTTPTAGAVYGGTVTGPGFGQAFIGPTSGGDLWSLDQCSVSTSVGLLDTSQCIVYAGPLPLAQYQVAPSLAGGGTQFGMGGVPVPFGWFFWALWTGGTPGAFAYLRLTGVKTVLTNSS